MKKKSVTMSDIAKAMDISTVTVSKALGDKDGVSDELREKIKQKANEMGYRFSYTSKSSKEGFTFNISIVVAKHFINDASAFYWVMSYRGASAKAELLRHTRCNFRKRPGEPFNAEFGIGQKG